MLDDRRCTRNHRLGGHRRWPTVVVTAAALVAGLVGGPVQGRTADTAATRIIATADPGQGPAVARTLERLGGHVDRALGALDMVAGTVPADQLSSLRGDPAVRALSVDGSVALLDETWEADDASRPTSMLETSRRVRAWKYWLDGYTGDGVDVALIDSGVAPVPGLDGTGKVVHGPDLSSESVDDDTRHVDTYGHGTHMAGIIAAQDPGEAADGIDSHDRFLGVAPGARLVSLKVADRSGATDVSQILAAVDWVVQHRHTDGLDIRVLNLSFGTDSAQDYRLDPLAHAVEVAWRHGIVVVVAAGNNGSVLGRLTNPAIDPYVIAVGADDPRGTTRTYDDVIPPFSSRGDGTRNPDVVAPGISILSLRAPGGQLDQDHPGAVVDNDLFRGTGTSQAAAVVSGAAALILDQHPDLTPDQVKAILVGAARPVPAAPSTAQGAGLIDLASAETASVPTVVQTWDESTGTGSLDAARGSFHLERDGEVLDGEVDIFGRALDTATWATGADAGDTWSGGDWNGSTWTGSTWTGSTWTGSTWTGSTWTGSTWTAAAWD